MDKYQSMQVFAQVVDCKSFSRAAQSLDLPRSTVSTVVQRLEAHLRVRLLDRTTRHVALTPLGMAYYEHCVRILSDVQASERTINPATAAASGEVRVALSGVLAQAAIIPKLANFNRRHPGVKVILDINDAPLDTIRDTWDFVIDIGNRPAQAVTLQVIGELEWVIAASPAYIARHGAPCAPDDLRSHDEIRHVGPGASVDESLASLRLPGDDKIDMPSHLAVNSLPAMVSAAVHGLGVAQLPFALAQPHLEAGRLIELLRPWRPTPSPIVLAQPNGRRPGTAATAFEAWASEACADF